MEMSPIDVTPMVGSAANSLNIISNEGLLGAITVLAIFIAFIQDIENQIEDLRGMIS